MNLRNSVDELIKGLIIDCNPYETVKKCLTKHQFNDGNIYVVAIGKAAYTMALGAKDSIPNIHAGVVISKYKHILSDIANFKCFEAGHPIMDENTIIATNYVLDLTSNLKANDEVIFLISGGGSALFESPKIALKDLQDINNQLLKSGANINEINIIRKRLSNVKAGRFAEHCAPSKVTSIILSDVIGNDLSSIASGPSVVDYSSYEDAINIVNKYSIKINDEIKKLLLIDTPKELFNVENKVIGSVDILCDNAKNRLTDLGYQVSILDTKATQDVDEISKQLIKLAIDNQETKQSLAFIIGGEATVKVKGTGLGGRNQQLALNACKALEGLNNTCIFGFGSDGTDGPTDAAGGYVDENSNVMLKKLNIDVEEYLNNNDSYNCLKQINGLLLTGPTGSNVNDIYCLLIQR